MGHTIKKRICHFLVNWIINQRTFLLDTELVSNLKLDLDLSKEADFDTLLSILSEITEGDASLDQPFLASVLILSFPYYDHYKEKVVFENVSGYGCYISGPVAVTFAIEEKRKCTAYWEEQNRKNSLSFALDKYEDFKPAEKSQHREIDYIEVKRQQKELGNLGELFVMEVLKRELIVHGTGNFQPSVVKMPDIEGYDFLLLNEKGERIFIEVKTTIKGMNEPFYISRNEYVFLKGKVNSYFLYRVYDFDIVAKVGKIAKISGTDLLAKFGFEPTEYLAQIR